MIYIKNLMRKKIQSKSLQKLKLKMKKISKEKYQKIQYYRHKKNMKKFQLNVKIYKFWNKN